MKTTKRPACIWLLRALLLLSPAFAADAQFNYVTNNGAIILTAYTGPVGAVTIPDTIDGLPVTGIVYPQFPFGYGGMITVVIPNNVTNIDNNAFYGSNLRSVTISSTSLRIGSQAFGASLSLTNVTIAGPMSSIGNGAFSRCTSLPSFTIPNGVSVIEDATFHSCDNLVEIEIPASVTKIGEYAFYSCFSLKNVTIPGNVTNIGTLGFGYCFSLTNMMVPASIATIGDQALYSCASLPSIVVDLLNPFFSSVDGVLFDKSRSTLITFPAGKGGSYTVPDGVNRITGWAFASCPNLTDVTIPNTVTNIGSDLFLGCTSLTNVIIGSGLSDLANWTFYACSNLLGVYFQGDAPTAPSDGSNVFGDTAPTIYYLPGTVGWMPTFGGRPTALWRPTIQVNSASFGISSNRFAFTVFWGDARTVIVDACANLTTPNWLPLTTNTTTAGTFFFRDFDSIHFPSRFYRLRWP